MNAEQSASPDRSVVDVSLFVLRVIVGVIFMAHGSQKFGFIGEGSFAATVEKMGGGVLPYLVSVGEFFGGLGLIVGFLTRFSAASLIVIMIGAIVLVHGAAGFFAPKGFEYNLALIGLLLPILLCGPGRYSIGRLFLPRSKTSGRPIVFLE